jgi:hypothetical protein
MTEQRLRTGDSTLSNEVNALVWISATPAHPRAGFEVRFSPSQKTALNQ